jgi:hypothetical protein
MKMLRRVLVLGRIAATHMATRHAQSQVDPNVTDLKAFFTPAGMGSDMLNLICMLAVLHLCSLVKIRVSNQKIFRSVFSIIVRL